MRVRVFVGDGGEAVGMRLEMRLVAYEGGGLRGRVVTSGLQSLAPLH